jgi:hypothetical protein
MCTVLDIMKQSCRGLSREEFLKKTRVEGIARPLPELKDLYDRGFVRIDQSPPPTRFKATNIAFQ